MTTQILSITSFADRKAQLQADLEKAEQAYSEAALADAVGTGSEDEMTKAKATVELAQDRIQALDAAWQQAQKHHLATKKVEQAEAYRQFVSDLNAVLKRRRKAAIAAIEAAEAVANAELEFEASEEEIRRIAAKCEANTRAKRLVETINLSLPSQIIAGLANAVADRKRRPEPRSSIPTPGEAAIQKLNRSDEQLRGRAAHLAPEALKENA